MRIDLLMLLGMRLEVIGWGLLIIGGLIAVVAAYRAIVDDRTSEDRRLRERSLEEQRDDAQSSDSAEGGHARMAGTRAKGIPNSVLFFLAAAAGVIGTFLLYPRDVPSRGDFDDLAENIIKQNRDTVTALTARLKHRAESAFDSGLVAIGEGRESDAIVHFDYSLRDAVDSHARAKSHLFKGAAYEYWAQKAQTTGSAPGEDLLWSRAIECFDSSLSIDPSYPEARYAKGTVLSRLGDHKAAVKELNVAVAFSPELCEAWCNLGCNLLVLCEYDEAGRALDKAIDCRGDYSEAHFNMGLALLATEDYASAEKSIRRSLGSDSLNAQAWYALGKVQLATDRDSLSLISFGQAMALGYLDHDIMYDKSRALQSRGWHEEAIISFDLCRTSFEADPWYWCNFANSLHHVDSQSLAIECYKKALSLDTCFAECWYNLALTCGRWDRNEEALDAYDHALNCKSDYAVAWLGRGLVVAQMGDLEDAKWCFKKAFEYDPLLRELPWTDCPVSLMDDG